MYTFALAPVAGFRFFARLGCHGLDEDDDGIYGSMSKKMEEVMMRADMRSDGLSLGKSG